MKNLIDKILLGRFGQSKQEPIQSAMDILGDGHSTRPVPHLLNHIIRIPISRIHADKDQVRKFFDESKLEELSESIKENGVIQPILIRPHPTYKDKTGSQHYQIIAGERRWRASQLAKLQTMPCIILKLDEDQIFQISLIENIQREQLNAIEEARAYLSLHEKYEHSYDDIAVSVGKSRSHIANTIRLLKLPEVVQSELAEGNLSRGHARAIIGAENPAELVNEITQKKLNVRQVEQRVKFQKRKKRPPIETAPVDNDWRGDITPYQETLKRITGSKTDLRKNAKGGLTLKVFIETREDIEAFLTMLAPQGTQDQAAMDDGLATNFAMHGEITSDTGPLNETVSNTITPKTNPLEETTLSRFSPSWPSKKQGF